MVGRSIEDINENKEANQETVIANEGDNILVDKEIERDSGGIVSSEDEIKNTIQEENPVKAKKHTLVLNNIREFNRVSSTYYYKSYSKLYIIHEFTILLSQGIHAVTILLTLLF